MVRMLIILRHPILSIGKYPLPFLVPVILSVHIPLGACSKPVSLDAPVTHHGVSYKRFLLHHTNCDSNTGIHFCMLHDIDPYIRKFVSPVGHSHHGYFIEPPAYRLHRPPLGDFPQHSIMSRCFSAFMLLC